MLSHLGHTHFTHHSGSQVGKFEHNPHDMDKQVQKNEKLEKTDQTEVSDQQAVAKTFDVDALVENLYDQLASKVALRSKGNEQEQEALWQQAKDGIASGFAEAKDVIKAFGQMDDQLNEKIDNAQATLFERINEQQKVQEFNKVESSYSHKEQKSFAMELMTKEGDRVRLLFDQSSHFKGRENAHGMDLSQLDMEQMRLDVVGDLSEEELEDIKDLFKDVSKLSNEFYKGNMDSAFDLASKLNIDDSTLMQMDLNLSSMTQTSATTSFRPNEAINSYNEVMPEKEQPFKQLMGQSKMANMLEFLEGFDQQLEQQGLPKLGQWMQQAKEANEQFMQMLNQDPKEFWSSDIAKLDSLF